MAHTHTRTPHLLPTACRRCSYLLIKCGAHTHAHAPLVAGRLPQVFLRAGHMAQLDKLRTATLHSAAVAIQRHCMGFLARRRYQEARRAVMALQVPGVGSNLMIRTPRISSLHS